MKEKRLKISVSSVTFNNEKNENKEVNRNTLIISSVLNDFLDWLLNHGRSNLNIWKRGMYEPITLIGAKRPEGA